MPEHYSPGGAKTTTIPDADLDQGAPRKGYSELKDGGSSGGGNDFLGGPRMVVVPDSGQDQGKAQKRPNF